MLKSFLGSLPGEMAARLASAVETDRLCDGHVLPHDAILEGLRPALRETRCDRTPTPMRLFCLPFEDLLTSAPRKRKQKASIPRTSLMPVWTWLSRDVMPGELGAYAADVKALILARDFPEANARAAAFWPQAADGMLAALADPKARQHLADADILADVQEMTVLLAAGADVLKIQAALPRPVPQLTEELLWQLRAIYDDLVARQPDAAPFVAVIAMNRLAHPCEALRLPMQICRQRNDTLISQTDMGLVGEILFTRMGAARDAVLSTRHPHFEAQALLDNGRHFTEVSSAIVKEIELKRDGEWGQRLLKERAQVGNVMDGFMDRALKEFAAALPMHKGTGARADFSRPVHAEKLALAMRYAQLVRNSRNFAAAGSFAAKQKTAMEDLCAYLRRYIEDVVKELRGSDAASRAVAESQFAFCAELTALLFSEEEAELLRRRGRAAQSTAA